MFRKNNDLLNSVLFLSSSFFSEITLYIYDIWIVIFLYQRGAVELSGFFISQLLPAVLMLFFGVTIDKFDRKKVLIITKVFRIIMVILLLTNQSTMAIYAITFILSFFTRSRFYGRQHSHDTNGRKQKYCKTFVSN